MIIIDADIVIVTETHWSSELQLDSIKIPGYQLAARADRKPDNHGGGCCIFAKDHILFSDAIGKSINWQSQLCSIKIKDIYIIGLYRRPHYNKLADTQLINYLKTEFDGKRIILSGDLNLPGIDWDSEIVSADKDNVEDSNRSVLSLLATRNSAWQEFVIEMGYEQFIKTGTHNLGNVLDVVISNKGSNIVRSKPEVDFATFQGYSDHAGIIFHIDIIIEHSNAMKTVFDYKNCDYAKLTKNFFKKKVGLK